MSFLSRLLSAVVLTLAILYAAVLLIDVSSGKISSGHTKSVSVHKGKDDTSLSSVILSRLNLIPFFRGDRALFAVVIENHEEARPHQKGLSSALLVEEYMVEGMISRFIAVFDQRAIPASVGPVRSLRPYFVDGVLPWVGAVFHAGGSPEGFERAKEEESVFRDINGLAFPDDFLRDDGIPPPHNLFVSRDHLKSLLQTYGKDRPGVTWPPFPVGSAVGAEKAEAIRINFYSKLHDVSYDFDAFTGTYTRTNGGIVSEAHPHNVLVLGVPIDSTGEKGRLFMTLTGQGDALLFHSGTVQKGHWIRRSLNDSWTFKTKDGEEFAFAQGQIWMTVVPEIGRVSWK